RLAASQASQHASKPLEGFLSIAAACCLESTAALFDGQKNEHIQTYRYGTFKTLTWTRSCNDGSWAHSSDWNRGRLPPVTWRKIKSSDSPSHGMSSSTRWYSSMPKLNMSLAGLRARRPPLNTSGAA